MFWCSLAGADRPPKQAMPVARQEDLGLCVLWSLSLLLQSVPRCKNMTFFGIDVLVFFGRGGPPAKRSNAGCHCLFRAERFGLWCPLLGAESDSCGEKSRWKGPTSRQIRVCVCVCFLPIHSGLQWTYQPGSHRKKVTQDFPSTFFLRCLP